MRLRTALALIGISLLTQGCQLAWQTTTNLAFETCLFTDNMTSKVQYCLQARDAWKEYLSHHGGGDYCADFAKGFKEGYQDFLEGGGDTAPPPAPPMKYWKVKYQNAAGREAAKMWSLGYKEGATAAKTSGARNFIVVPVNKGTPPGSGPGAPPGPALGMPGLSGQPALPPQLTPPVQEIELPAPRPATGNTLPPQANKTGAVNQGVPQLPQKSIGSTASSPGQQPATILDGVPMQSIRSLLVNKRTPPPSGAEVEQPGSTTGMPGSTKPAEVLPPSNPPPKPQMLPPVPEKQSLAPRPAPAKAVPPQDNKTTSAKPVAPQLPQKRFGFVASPPGQQPAKATDTVPVQPILSILTNKRTPPAPRPAVVPSGPVSGMLGVNPGAAPRVHPPVPQINAPAPRPAPARVVRPVPQKPAGSVTSRAGQQPAKAPDNAPVQSIQSLISPEGNATSEENSDTAPVQSIRSLLPQGPPQLPAPRRLPAHGSTNPTGGPERIRTSSAIGMPEMKKAAVSPATLAYRVGMAAMQGGDIENGLCWLRSAVKEDPNYAPAHKALMDYYQKIGDGSQAAAHRIKAETQTP